MKYYFGWAKDDEIRERGANGGFVTATLMGALETGLIDAALVVKKYGIYEGVPVLTSDTEVVKESAGSLHAAPLNVAKIIVKYAKDMRLGVPVKPCDARGIIEQAKRKQLNIENVFMIGLNCGGTLHPLLMREMVASLFDVQPDVVLKEEIREGKIIIMTSAEGLEERAIRIDEAEERGFGRRYACKICTTKIPRMADMACGNWGVPREESHLKTFVEVLTEKGEALLRNAIDGGYVIVEEAPQDALDKRNRTESYMQRRASYWKARLDVLADSERRERFEYYIKMLKKCIHCGACKEVCPVCACVEDAKCHEFCDESDDHIVSIFNLIRILHLMDSCILCGQCEDVCPVDIPLTYIHRRFSERMQKKLGYTPGMDISQKPPLHETKLLWEAE
ncbi:MAG: Coenzyme F420 hydrogenase/dehydrogenase, beta subunit C-terminal domain [Canidatus Methanoxibalbensis ujae]|nr:Coenzyme F420 hydrogenase/dehydrogenase, beta subunit C-terminal domain [Candidatus Methanoxibalbensis ujae]